MRTTPNLNLPYAEGTDARRDFPAVVDGPRTIAIDAALGPAAEPASGRAVTVPDSFSVGTGWTELTTLVWTSGGGATHAGSVLTVPAGLYLVNFRLNVQSLAADGQIQARTGQSSPVWDLGGTAISNIAAHWHAITGVYPMEAAGDLRFYLASNAARNANFVAVTVVRLGDYDWT